VGAPDRDAQLREHRRREAGEDLQPRTRRPFTLVGDPNSACRCPPRGRTLRWSNITALSTHEVVVSAPRLRHALLATVAVLALSACADPTSPSAARQTPLASDHVVGGASALACGVTTGSSTITCGATKTPAPLACGVTNGSSTITCSAVTGLTTGSGTLAGGVTTGSSTIAGGVTTGSSTIAGGVTTGSSTLDGGVTTGSSTH
jgi:hypothetical protein